MTILLGASLSFALGVAALAVPYLTVEVLMTFCSVTDAQARLWRPLHPNCPASVRLAGLSLVSSCSPCLRPASMRGISSGMDSHWSLQFGLSDPLSMMELTYEIERAVGAWKQAAIGTRYQGDQKKSVTVIASRWKHWTVFGRVNGSGWPH